MPHPAENQPEVSTNEAAELTRRFAVSLDTEDYATALALLDPECEYTIRGQTLRGPDAIVASYKGNGDIAARSFDEITYGSEIAPGTGPAEGWVVIRFFDRILHQGEHLEHVCEQWVCVSAGSSGGRRRIIRIEHHDLPGERERLGAFRARFGL